MPDAMTVAELRAFLEDVNGDRTVYFLGSGAIHDCIGGEAQDIEWNTGDVEPAVMLGGHGAGVDDPREGNGAE